jgi:bifunctional DNase/RNase
MRTLVFPVGLTEGTALALALRRMESPRPMTHELFMQVLQRVHIDVIAVRLIGREHGNYLAELDLMAPNGRERVAVPALRRLVLALRMPVPAPILVDERLLEQARATWCRRRLSGTRSAALDLARIQRTGTIGRSPGLRHPRGDLGLRLLRPLVGDAHQQRDEDVVGQQRRAAVGHEGQGDAGEGQSRTTPAMMKKAWNPMMMVSPVAIRREKSERAVWAMRRPAPTIRMKANTTAAAPIMPISIPMAAKIMSR